MPPPTPNVQASVLCDAAICVPNTGKWTLIGAWTHLSTPSPPDATIKIAAMGIYYCISDAEGQYQMQIEVIKLDGLQETVLSSVQIPMNFQDRLTMYDFGANIGNPAFPGHGKYLFRLSANGENISEKPFVVQGIQLPGAPNHPPDGGLNE